MITIDHVVIAGSDLAKLRATFESIGLIPVEGGVHADGQTHNALIPFPDGLYLELIAPTPGSIAPDHPWSEFMRTDAGVCAWAISSNDIQADVGLYRSRGITVGDPTPGGRTRPDGVRLEWISAKLGKEPLGSLLPFLIQDVTPREWRVPPSQIGDGLITGIEKIIIEFNDDYPESDPILTIRRAFKIPQHDRKIPETYYGTSFGKLSIDPNMYSYDQQESKIVGQLRRKRGYDAFFAARAQHLEKENIPVVPIEGGLAGGRLMIYESRNCLFEGYMHLISDGLYDESDDRPPCDTWVYFDSVAELLICWIPQAMFPFAQEGIEGMSADWVWWVTGDTVAELTNYEFIRILRLAGFFDDRNLKLKVSFEPKNSSES